MKEDYEAKQIEYVRGKIAGNDVPDRDGSPIIRKGEWITDEVIQKAKDAGQLHYLMIAAASSVVGERGDQVKQRLQVFKGVTEGHEADFVRGGKAGRDVADFSGRLLVHEGDTVTDDVIEKARHEGVLDRLVVAVGAPGIDLEEEE